MYFDIYSPHTQLFITNKKMQSQIKNIIMETIEHLKSFLLWICLFLSESHLSFS